MGNLDKPWSTAETFHFLASLDKVPLKSKPPLTIPDKVSLDKYRQPDELVAWYRFWTGGGDTLKDFSKYGNHGTIYGACLTGDTLIYTPSGAIQISDIKTGDKVYVYNEGIGVKRVVEKIYSGIKPVYRIRTSNREIYATENHPFLVPVWRGYRQIKGYNRSGKHPYNYKKGLWSLEWIPLRRLREGLAIVCLHKVPDDNRTEFSEDFMRLVGCYLGDGNIIHRKNRSDDGIYLALYKKEDQKRYAEILTKLGIKHIVRKDGIHIYNTELARMFKELDLDGDVYSKHIPKWVWKLPNTHKRALIEGILDADGWRIQQTPNNLTFVIELANQTLVKQLKALCNSIGLRASNIGYRKRKGHLLEGRMLPDSEVWGFQIYPNKGRNREPRVIWNGVKRRLNILLPDEFEFQRITTIEYVGERRVYDISIPEVHNFIAEGIVVHNSWIKDGGLRALYFSDFGSDYVKVPDSPSLDITDAVTLEVLLKTPGKLADTVNPHVLRKNYAYFLVIEGDTGRAWFRIWSGGTGYDVYGTSDLFDDKYHVAHGVYDGSEMGVYVDGMLENTKALTGKIDTSTNPLYISYFSSTAPETFLGYIALARLYSRDLTKDENTALWLGLM